MPTIFPDQTIVKLKTVILQNPTTDPTTGGFAWSLKANSVADPMGTLSISAQPTGLDQLIPYYNRYYVAAAKLEVKLYPSIDFTNADQPWQVVVFPAMEALVESDYFPTGTIQSQEQPYARYAEQFYTGGIGYIPRIRSFMTTHKISGGQYDKKNAFCTGELTTTPVSATDPIALWYFNGRIEKLGNTGDADMPTLIRVTLTQYVAFFNRAQIPDSVQ